MTAILARSDVRDVLSSSLLDFESRSDNIRESSTFGVGLEHVTSSSRRTLAKQAELGGDGHDADFETSFSNIAHTFLRDKAPTLQQYEVGFQLLDRNEEGNRAVGITGFKVGRQWLYAPVFFLQGKLKGQELLYLKNEDQFVPMKETWINDILNKRPSVLGEPVDRSPWRNGITSPNLQFFSRSPGKMGAAIAPNLLPGAAAVAYWATHSPFTDSKYDGIIDLPTFLKKEGHAVIGKLCRTLMAFPKLAQAFEKMYGGLGIIKEAIEASRVEPDLGGVLASRDLVVRPFPQLRKSASGVLPETEKINHLKSGALAYFTKSSSQEVIDRLTDDEREAILRDGIVFRDKRAEEEVSTAYTVQSPLSLSNPDQTGVYDLLVRPGKFERCLVVIGPFSTRHREHFATVVRLDGGRNYLNIHPSRLWIKQQNTLTNKEYDELLDGLETADSLPVSRSYHGDKYILIGKGGVGTCPFRARYEPSTDGGTKIYDVSVDDYAERYRPGDLSPLHSRDYDSEPYGYCDGEFIHLTGKDGAELKVMAGALYVPKGMKLLKAKEWKESKEEIKGEGYDGEVIRSESPSDIVPGNRVDLQQVIFDKTAELKVSHLGSEVQIDGLSMSPMKSLIYLVACRGLREKAARVVLRDAEKHRVVKFRVKQADPYSPYAQGYELQQTAPGGPGFPDPPLYDDGGMGMAAQSFGPFEMTQPAGLPQGDRSSYDPRIMPDPSAIQSAMTMAQGGQREIFDASMMGSLLKEMRDDTMVDRHLPDLMRAMDRLGRILFSFYWHGEEFQDRLGKQDMPEMEDGLRNTFESLGDTIMGLKQKTVEPFQDEVSADLSDVAR